MNVLVTYVLQGRFFTQTLDKEPQKNRASYLSYEARFLIPITQNRVLILTINLYEFIDSYFVISLNTAELFEEDNLLY